MADSNFIPFNRASLVGKELGNIADAILRGQSSGDGPYTRKCHALLQECLGVPKVLLTTSCTDALEMSALLLGIAPGDEVIVPSFTLCPLPMRSCSAARGRSSSIFVRIR